jgi:hypothetical protein
MPYSNPKQAVAIFLDLQRKKGQEAARAFAQKHKKDMSGGKKPYKPRSGRKARSV